MITTYPPFRISTTIWMDKINTFSVRNHFKLSSNLTEKSDMQHFTLLKVLMFRFFARLISLSFLKRN